MRAQDACSVQYCFKKTRCKEIIATQIKNMKKNNECLTIESFIEQTKSVKAIDRKQALKEMCPCRVLKDIDVIWERVLEMAENEPDADVRYQIMHTLCDGSPKHRETQVIEALEKMWSDPNEKLRRQVRRVLASYRRTGEWNIL
jgi:restriction endonuclease Mrr